jgi:hypothetical protein
MFTALSGTGDEMSVDGLPPGMFDQFRVDWPYCVEEL